MQGQKARYLKDKRGDLQALGECCIQEDPENLGSLSCLNILYAWRDPPKYDQHKHRIVHGEAIRLRSKERDLFGYDVMIVMAQKIWKELSASQREKLMWHELYHFYVPLDDAAAPVTDDHGRIKIQLRDHDLNMERFEAEIDKFGPDSEELVTMKRISRLYKKSKVKKDAAA